MMMITTDDDDDDGGGNIEGAQSVDIVRCCRGDDWQVIEPVLVSAAAAGRQISNGQKFHRCKGRSTKYQMKKILKSLRSHRSKKYRI